MALRGQNTGGYMFALPMGYDDMADFSVFLWIRRAATGDAGDRILTVCNTGRSRGVQLHLGGGVGGSSAVSDLVVSVGSGTTTGWGSAVTHGGRGRAIVPGLPAGAFMSVAFSVRGPSAADFSGSAGAQQIHDIWANGTALPGAIATTASGSSVPATGGRWSLLCRDASTPGYFDGWVAEAALWQGHRLAADEVALLHRGADARQVMPGALLFYRSCRAQLAAEVGDTPPITVGSGGIIEAAVHPPLLVAGASARHGQGAASPVLSVGAAAPGLAASKGVFSHTASAPVLMGQWAQLAVARARHIHRAMQAWLGMPGRLGAENCRHGVSADAAAVQVPGMFAEILVVDDETRVARAELP